MRWKLRIKLGERYYDRTENIKVQIEGLINNGVMLYEGYKRAVKECKKDMNELMASFGDDKKEIS